MELAIGSTASLPTDQHMAALRDIALLCDKFCTKKQQMINRVRVKEIWAKVRFARSFNCTVGRYETVVKSTLPQPRLRSDTTCARNSVRHETLSMFVLSKDQEEQIFPMAQNEIKALGFDKSYSQLLLSMATKKVSSTSDLY